MKISYDAEVDVLTILLSDQPIVESNEENPGVILDFDANGNVVSIEIINASKKMANPLAVEYVLNQKAA